MKRKTGAAALCALLAGLAVAGGAAAGTDDHRTLVHQGIERNYTVRLPDRTVRRPLPLVVALHGQGQTVRDIREWLPFDPVADREGFALVWPQAVDLRWSYGRPLIAPMPAVGGVPVDDVGFIRRVIDRLIAEGIADPKRVYVAGVSRGAIMAYTLACAIAGRLAAFAPIVSGMSAYQRENCHPSRPVPVIAVAGRSDIVNPYDGWLWRGGRLMSVPETMEFWRSLHGCTRQSIRRLPDLDPHDRTFISLIGWHGCRGNALVRLYRVTGGGHRVPSFAPPDPKLTHRFGRRSRDMDTAEELWRLFRNITL